MTTIRPPSRVDPGVTMEETMSRTTLTALALALAATLVGPSAALAASPELKAQKREVKEARVYDRQVEKLVRKWQDAAAKGKADKMAKLDGDLMAVTRGELERLRELGVKTRAPAPVAPNPDFPEKIPVVAPEHPKMEALRDRLVELRDLQDRFDRGEARPKDVDRKAALLGQLAESVDERHARKAARYEAAKRA